MVQIRMLADTNGGFARLLGVDLNLPEEKGPHSQRYAWLTGFSMTLLNDKICTSAVEVPLCCSNTRLISLQQRC